MKLVQNQIRASDHGSFLILPYQIQNPEADSADQDQG